LKLIFDVF